MRGNPGAGRASGHRAPRGGSARCTATDVMSWSSLHPLSTGGSHKTSCELQDPRGTPGLGGVVGSGCLSGGVFPSSRLLPPAPEPTLCGPLCPASGQPLHRCFYSVRSKVSDSQDVETSRLPVHRAAERQNAAVTVLTGRAPSTGLRVSDDRPKHHAQSKTPKGTGGVVPCPGMPPAGGFGHGGLVVARGWGRPGSGGSSGRWVLGT